ncbi:MAG: hypothetical protein ACHQIO_19755 [Nevskiales bacterium]
MSTPKLIAVTLLGLSLGACVTQPLNDVPLVWKPTSELNFGGVDLSEAQRSKIQFEPFVDARKQPALIAENREDAVPKPVTTNGNVGEFVSANVRQILDHAGLDTVDSGGDVIVSGEVRNFFVEETSLYEGTVLLHLSVRNRAGVTLWSGSASGTAKRFGRSYSQENYYEVLSDALINATVPLVQDWDFRRALAGLASSR